MPLNHLIDTFNHRFIQEHQLDTPPFDFQGGRVFGRFGDLTFTSDFRPIRQLSQPIEIRAHETSPLVFSAANTLAGINSGITQPESSRIVSLDRLSRTVHMLNYLLLDLKEGTLFLHVHPQHILSVTKDHGAYFEEIILACGLPLRRVAISLTLSSGHIHQWPLLLDRLKNYRDRGYAIAIRFDNQATEDSIIQFRNHHFHRLAPDHVRLSINPFAEEFKGRSGERERQRLFGGLRQQDTQVHLTNIRSSSDLDLSREIGADYIEGAYLEEAFSASAPLRRSA